MVVKASFWRGRRVFITGHTGFKGSWLCLWLQALGADVTGYALKAPTDPSLFEQAKVANDMNSIEGDIRDADSILQAMQKASPEVVIHMAAQPLVRYSYENPVETYSTNVMGSVHLLEAVRKTSSVRAVVNVTTDKCYQNREWHWGYREDEAMGGYDPYSSSKGCSELLTAAYRSSYFNSEKHAEHGVGIATARAGNVIGGGDWALDRLIPDVIAAFDQNNAAVIRNPDAIRPWQHVLEPLRGYLMLAERLFEDGPSYADAWNFGPSDADAKPVQWIVEQMAIRWGDEAKWDAPKGDHPHEASHLKLDISKAKASLGWEPILALDDSLNLIIDWSKAYRSGADAREISLQQINYYQDII